MVRWWNDTQENQSIGRKTTPNCYLFTKIP